MNKPIGQETKSPGMSKPTGQETKSPGMSKPTKHETKLPYVDIGIPMKNVLEKKRI